MKEHSLPPFILMPVEALMDDRLTLRELRTLMAICSWRKSNTNIARVSREMLADRTGYSKQRVSTATTSLVQKGWITKLGDGGRGKWSHYALNDLDDMMHSLQSGNGQSKNDTKNGNGSQNGNGYQNGNETVTESGTKTVTESGTHKHTERSTGKDTERVGAYAPAPAKFIPPTVEQVADYMASHIKTKSQKPGYLEINPLDDAEAFVNHFTSNGWRVGGKAKMKCWHSAAQNWLLRSAQGMAKKSRYNARPGKRAQIEQSVKHQGSQWLANKQAQLSGQGQQNPLLDDSVT